MYSLKIGSRLLSEDEATLILPTYKDIFEQIKNIRNSFKNDKDENSAQKTNNIGILGCRGAGKTSLLKTIARELKKDEDNNDIILPIIIPENMSTASTLMATILGLFKNEVDKIESNKQKKINMGNCTSESYLSLKRKYNEVIKQYTFIQKEYRDILINEFTSENEYVKKSNQIFNSDIEFITKFNEFIEEIVSVKGGNALIFFFIDDIDLSTSRCTDVVKTLLSYVSNKHIVTFISGDLDTFEEALTIDFLRQENALTNHVWDGNFLNNDDTLLERKKLMAYEYLKKVVPPMYRHNIKRWSLENRGDYVVKLAEKGSSINLKDLLVETLSYYIEPSFFKFINYKAPNSEKEETLHYTYHLFDDTSRGINNVYNVLLLINNRKKENGEIEFSDRKLLIETIAASKPVYNKFREQLFNNIINFGINEETSMIRFDNLMYLIEDDQNTDEKHKDDKNGEVIYSNSKKGIPADEKFQMFIFVDFAARLVKFDLISSQISNLSYIKLKDYIINILINNPIISGSSHTISADNAITLNKQIISKNSGDFTILVSNFLLNSKWDFTLTLYKYLSLNTYEIIPKEKNINNNIMMQDYILDLSLAIKSIAKVRKIEEKDYIASIYDKFTIEFAYIQESMSNDEISSTIEIIYNDLGMMITENRGTIRFRLLCNSLREKLRTEIFDPMNKIRELNDKDFENIKSEKDTIRLKIIKNIDHNNLWDHPMTSNVYWFIWNKIFVSMGSIMKHWFNENNSLINIGTFKNNSFNEFERIYKGVSNTKASKLEDNINTIVKNKIRINLNEWNRLIELSSSLAYNNRVYYGQYEAQKMLNELKFQSYADFVDDTGEKLDCTELIMFLHLYAIYRIKVKNLGGIYLQSKQLAEFINNVSASQGKVNSKMINDFINIINKGIDKEINIEEFNDIFKQENRKC